MRNVKAVKKIHHSKTKVKGSVDSTPTRKQGESHTLLAQAEGWKSCCASGKGSTRTTPSLLPACVFITTGPIIKLCAGGEGDSEGHVL